MENSTVSLLQVPQVDVSTSSLTAVHMVREIKFC